MVYFFNSRINMTYSIGGYVFKNYVWTSNIERTSQYTLSNTIDKLQIMVFRSVITSKSKHSILDCLDDINNTSL